jgi:hypothetical protein
MLLVKVKRKERRRIVEVEASNGMEKLMQVRISEERFVSGGLRGKKKAESAVDRSSVSGVRGIKSPVAVILFFVFAKPRQLARRSNWQEKSTSQGGAAVDRVTHLVPAASSRSRITRVRIMMLAVKSS